MSITVTKTDKQGTHLSDVTSERFANREIWITGKIDASLARTVIEQIEHLSSVSADEITLKIMSPGGEVSGGLAILDALRMSRCEIVTHCIGQVYSMAAVIACAAGKKGKRFIWRHSDMMIHQPIGDVSGNASEIVRAAAHITRTRTILNTLLAEATGQSIERIETDTAYEDRFFDAEEAVAYGLADYIL